MLTGSKRGGVPPESSVVRLCTCVLLVAAAPSCKGQDIDVDECASAPCANGAVCVDSSFSDAEVAAAFGAGVTSGCCWGLVDWVQVPLDSYSCLCQRGYSNGVCENWQYWDQEGVIRRQNGGEEYETFPILEPGACSVMDSTWGFSQGRESQGNGNCDIEIDQCLSNPCANGGTCSMGVAWGEPQYKCECAPGWACDPGFGSVCPSPPETQAPWPTNCDMDPVDECQSGPCANGAECTQWSQEEGVFSHLGYRCKCVAGFANGACDYDYLTEYETECTVMESSQSDSLSGNCDLNLAEIVECEIGTIRTQGTVECADIDDCVGDPCGPAAAGECSDAGANSYSCACNDGYSGDGTTCSDTNGCADSPCFDHVEVDCYDIPAPDDGFTCDACPSGYNGDGITCSDIDDCADTPCGPAAAGTCADTGPNSYQCTCNTGFTRDATCAETTPALVPAPTPGQVITVSGDDSADICTGDFTSTSGEPDGKTNVEDLLGLLAMFRVSPRPMHVTVACPQPAGYSNYCTTAQRSHHSI